MVEIKITLFSDEEITKNGCGALIETSDGKIKVAQVNCINKNPYGMLTDILYKIKDQILMAYRNNYPEDLFTDLNKI